MPISSTEIAQMNGAFQQQQMQQTQYAGMIGQQGGPYGGSSYGAQGVYGQGAHSDQMMGRGMSMAGAIGSPLVAGGMALAGLDPLSLGLKAGGMALGSGAGLGGAAMAAGAVALPAMAVLGATRYMGQQMYSGAQQQMGLNNQLRQSFSFTNSQGGQGFNRNEMSAIGGAVREMSEQFGPGGEIASFRELSGLAGKMGSMGFAQGVRDVKDFTSRFKEMVKTLKGMATDLGTTLEGAMEFAHAAKGSGVFGMNRTAAFTAAARQTSVAGGLALSEVTGAANIGSQIARSVGGLGRQGANAGMRTIGQIGSAMQLGVLSEEDIYNVTGQTGAEGRQAYAASTLQSSARFLSGSRGRRMLASMAGENGTLDPAMVQQFMAGGMTVPQTMQQAQSHLGQVGRANFLRNEGRLRGAAMEQLSGFLPAMQMQQWARGKGIDINNMDDRSMLFAQRQLGMGRDEVDQAIKMANEMPQILEQQRQSGQQDSYFQSLAQSRKGQGISGVKQRLEQAKELINGKLQKVGQNIFNEGSEYIDAFMNKLTDVYVETYSKDIDKSIRAMALGGSAGRAAGTALGFGRSSIGNTAIAAANVANLAKGGGSGIGGAAEGLAASLHRGSTGGAWDSLLSKDATQLPKYFLHGMSGAAQLKEMGIDISGMNDAQIQARLKRAEAVRVAAKDPADGKLVRARSQQTSLEQMGRQGSAFLNTLYASEEVTGKNDDRIASIIAGIEKQANGDPKSPFTAQALRMRTELIMAGESREERARVIAGFERGAKIAPSARLAAQSGLPEGEMARILARQGRGGFTSMGEANTAFSEAWGGAKEKKGTSGWLDAALTVASGGVLGGVATWLRGRESRDEAQKRGEFLRSSKTAELTRKLLSEDSGTVETALKSLQEEIQDERTKGGGPITDIKEEMANITAFNIRNAQAGSKGGKPFTREEQEAFAKEHHTTVERLTSGIGNMVANEAESRRVNRVEAIKRVTAYSRQNLEGMATAGIIDSQGKITEAHQGQLKAIGKDALQYVEAAVEYETLGTRMTADNAQDTYDTRNDLVDKARKMRFGMSNEQLRAVGARGGELGAAAISEASTTERLGSEAKKGGGIGGATARLLGVDPKGLKMPRGKQLDLSKSEDVQKMLDAAGVVDDELSKKLRASGAMFDERGVGRKATAEEQKKNVAQALEGSAAWKEKERKEGTDPIAAAKANAKMIVDKITSMDNSVCAAVDRVAEAMAKLKP